ILGNASPSRQAPWCPVKRSGSIAIRNAPSRSSCSRSSRALGEAKLRLPLGEASLPRKASTPFAAAIIASEKGVDPRDEREGDDTGYPLAAYSRPAGKQCDERERDEPFSLDGVRPQGAGKLRG